MRVRAAVVRTVAHLQQEQLRGEGGGEYRGEGMHTRGRGKARHASSVRAAARGEGGEYQGEGVDTRGRGQARRASSVRAAARGGRRARGENAHLVRRRDRGGAGGCRSADPRVARVRTTTGAATTIMIAISPLRCALHRHVARGRVRTATGATTTPAIDMWGLVLFSGAHIVVVLMQVVARVCGAVESVAPRVAPPLASMRSLLRNNEKQQKTTKQSRTK